MNETQKDWDEDLDLLMYILRSVPNESTGISSFELMFGRKSRANLSMVKENILKGSFKEDQVSIPKYLKCLKEKLLHMYDFASYNLKNSQTHMKTLYDKKANIRSFKPGEEVLVYHPIPGSPMREKFMGPYKIIRWVTKTNYVLATPDRCRSTQLVHVNLLKPYVAPARRAVNNVIGDSDQKSHVVHDSSIVNDDSTLLSSNTYSRETDDHFINNESFIDETTVSWRNLENFVILKSLAQYLNHLPAVDKKGLIELLQQYSSICSDKPGTCTLVKHDVILEPNTQPIRHSFYRVSHHLLPVLKNEVSYLLEHNLAKPSTSPWASSCLLVRKPNNTYRMCTDYWRLNAATVKDAYPLPTVTDIFDSVSNAKFLSQMDLMKGYYQISLTERAQGTSAFITPFGLFEYQVLPFGMTNAPATFQRTMQEVIRGLPNVYVYLDDLVVASNTWPEQLATLKELFKKLQ